MEPTVVKTVSKSKELFENASFALEDVINLSFLHEVGKNKTVITVKKAMTIYRGCFFSILLTAKVINKAY